LFGTTLPGREQDLLGGATLVRRDDVLEVEQRLHRRFEAIERRASGVALVPALDGCPLFGGHRPRAGVGQEVHHHVVGVEREEIEARGLQLGDALLGRRDAQRLHRLDAKRLDDGLEVVHGRLSWQPPIRTPRGSGSSAGVAREMG
jgi:hypothetical protein